MFRIPALQLILLFFLSIPLNGQIRSSCVYGRVTDSVTLKPVADVSVFVPFTSHGTITNANGEFSLRQIPPGHIQLGFRHIAYVPRMSYFFFSGSDSMRCDLVMAGATIEIAEVVREAGKIDWEYGMILFREIFLGDSYQTSCIIRNPGDLYFYFDGDVIYGQSRNPLKITNNYLGYDITYYLDYFKFDKNRNQPAALGQNEFFAFGGLAFYTDKNAGDKVKKTKWIRNRVTEFQGSLRDFLQDFFHDAFWDRKYCLRKVDENGPDSIFYWDAGQAKGRYLRYDRMTEFPADKSVLTRGPADNLMTLSLPGPMLVFFDFLDTPDISDDRVSLLELNQGDLVFDRNGNLVANGSGLNWIDLDNQKRLKNTLPLDYEPNLNK